MGCAALFPSLRGAEALSIAKSRRRSNLEGGEVAKYTVILEPNYPEAKEAVEGFVEGLEKAGEPVPEEVTPVEMDTVTV